MRETFVESVVTRAYNADRMAEMFVTEGGRVFHMPSVPLSECQWEGCSALPTFLAGQWDTDTQDEDESTFRFYCHTHALVIQQTIEP